MKLNFFSLLIFALAFFVVSCSDDDDIIEENNTAPTIGNQSFSIPNNAIIGSSVGIVSASDEDNDALTYTITAGNDDNSFSIDSRGILFVEDAVSSDSYELTVQVADAISNASATITISVFESNISNPMAPFASILDGNLVGADYWSNEPEILSASMGFCDIGGIPGDELTQALVQEAGGAWLTDISCNASQTGLFTAAALQSQLAMPCILQTPYGDLRDGSIALDGLPIVFSWPVVTSTISLSDFKFTLNTGEVVYPLAASSQPNWELNERNCVVVWADWGNRLPSSDSNARFPVKLEIVADDTPLMLVGPGNQMVSAVGLTWENESNSSPYDNNNGPRLVGAKLNGIQNPTLGEGAGNPIINMATGFYPNDEFALYGGGDFKLRMLTTGGFSPDGVRGVLPTDYERFFRIHATGTNGETVLIEDVGVDYEVEGGTLRVVGLSDLGLPEGVNGAVYGDCYAEDRDNYIDIILEGDEAAARNITHLEIPSLEGGYDAFYNPGGPGTTSFSGVTYTQPGPRDLEPVIIALDNPMRVTN